MHVLKHHPQTTAKRINIKERYTRREVRILPRSEQLQIKQSTSTRPNLNPVYRSRSQAVIKINSVSVKSHAPKSDYTTGTEKRKSHT